MFQKEMAERIIGTYNTSKYGRLSILTNYRLNILKKFNVSSNCFFPKPKVESSVLFFKPKEKISINIKNIENLEKITTILFSNKRKMINKSIKKIFNKDKLDLIEDLDLKSRPSDLKPEKYYEITELFEKM
jgi:16S rRNA (adenine1518-N6/adenine1519-N6)-dimethyltransferase